MSFYDSLLSLHIRQIDTNLSSDIFWQWDLKFPNFTNCKKLASVYESHSPSGRPLAPVSVAWLSDSNNSNAHFITKIEKGSGKSLELS